ncbi:PaaI family thioesterase [Mycobacteroides abscessus]|nr:PaaI family thioesterase [Mycobacteroides abscessus]
MTVFRSGHEVYTDLVFDDKHAGAPGLAHGGAIAAACDDLFGFTLWIAGTPAVTRDLAVGYLRPVPLYQSHRIVARVDDHEGRTLHVSATGTGHDGVVRFTATATFIAVDAEHFAAHGDLGAFGEMLARFARQGASTERNDHNDRED